MLHKNVFLAHLQVNCATDDTELNKIAGQLRNLFYAASLPWSDGNLGRVIPRGNFDEFYGEFQKLRDAFYEAKPEDCSVALVVVPFPKHDDYPPKMPKKEVAALLWAAHFVSDALQQRFERRVRMLQTALEEEKRFYASLLSELEKVIKTGIYLIEDIKPELLTRMRKIQQEVLCYSADDIRKSTSVREEIMELCSGALL